MASLMLCHYCRKDGDHSLVLETPICFDCQELIMFSLEHLSGPTKEKIVKQIQEIRKHRLDDWYKSRMANIGESTNLTETV